MTDQKNTSTKEDANAPKPRLRDRAKNAVTRTPDKVKTSSIKEKAKTGLAVVGGTALVSGLAVYVAKKRGVNSVEATLPDLDVTEDAS